jgi:hypothetical protein
MVHAADAVAFVAPDRQRGEAVTAAIAQRRYGPVALSKKDDSVAEDLSREQLLAFDLMAPSADVPSIAKKHRHLPEMIDCLSDRGEGSAKTWRANK